MAVFETEMQSTMKSKEQSAIREIRFNIHDESEPACSEEKLKYLKVHDELTGLHSRAFFNEDVFMHSCSQLFPIAVLIIKIVGLGQINDGLGYASGDDLLKDVAKELKGAFHNDEIVARTAGDKFVVLVPQTDTHALGTMIERTRNRLHALSAERACPFLAFSLASAVFKKQQPLCEVLKQAEQHSYLDSAAQKLNILSLTPGNPLMIFEQIDQKLSISPGIRLSKLASDLGCERHIIERTVKTVKSMPYREYRQMRKLESALYLLEEKSLLIKEVAGLLGYTSPTSLWRLVKTRLSRSPSTFKALAEEIASSHTTNAESFSTSASPKQLKFNFPKP